MMCNPDDIERFHRYVVVDDVSGCAVWVGAHNHKGYGRFWADGRDVRAHRWAYETFVAPIPDGLVIDHLCRQRSCVEPSHLRAVTTAENLHAPGSLAVAKIRAEKTHCLHGHEFTPENTRFNDKGHRWCRRCVANRSADHHAKKKVFEPSHVRG